MASTRLRERLTSRTPRTAGRSKLRIAAQVLALLLLLISIVGVVAHYRTPGSGRAIGVSAFAPYLLVCAPLGALLLLAARSWWPLLVAALVTATCALTQIPMYTSTAVPAGAVRLEVMTSNLHLGEGDPAAVVAAVRLHHVDVLMLEEMTVPEQQRLVAAGLDRVLPFHVADARSDAGGTGLWSRLPLSHPTKRTDFNFGFVTARVRVPGVAPEPTLAALHMAGPWPNSSAWQDDIAHLPAVLPTLAATGAVIVGGDFNATPDVHQFRDLLVHGFRDAADQAGAGMTRTYPANRAFPPLIAIDHVLTRGAVGTTADTIEIPQSDHRALLTSVAVPRGRGATP